MATRTKATVVEVDVMTLFTEINRKLDEIRKDVTTKADVLELNQLAAKVTELEVHGSNNAQAAVKDVSSLEERISNLGWKVAAAFGTAMISAIFSLIVFLLERK